jgi:hypothetical protein
MLEPWMNEGGSGNHGFYGIGHPEGETPWRGKSSPVAPFWLLRRRLAQQTTLFGRSKSDMDLQKWLPDLSNHS